MPNPPAFKSASPYQTSVLPLPGADLASASTWYDQPFGTDERDSQKLQVFFAVAPDSLCYYFHEPVDPA